MMRADKSEQKRAVTEEPVLPLSGLTASSPTVPAPLQLPEDTKQRTPLSDGAIPAGGYTVGYLSRRPRTLAEAIGDYGAVPTLPIFSPLEHRKSILEVAGIGGNTSHPHRPCE